MRVVLADDHPVLRRGVAILLNAHPDVTVVAEASNGREALDECSRLKPDVVLMDLAMPRLSGLDATRLIRTRFPAIKVVILSAFGDAEAVGEAMAAGASAYIIKRSDIDELVLALKLVMSGNTYFSRELAERLDVAEISFSARSRGTSAAALTAREREILQLIAEGYTMKAIAATLCVSAKTVEGHNGRIMAKAGAKNRAELVRYALGAGIVRFDSLRERGRTDREPYQPAEEQEQRAPAAGAENERKRA